MTRHERLIGGCLLLALVGSGGFIAAYATGGRALYEGISLAVAAMGLCGAALGWAFWIVPDEQVADHIDEYPSPPAERATESREVREGVRDVSRSRALVQLLVAALGAFGLALIVPLRSLGPAPGGTLLHTKWRRGDRLTRIDGSFVSAGTLPVNVPVVVFPEGAVGDAMSQAVVIRLPQGIVCYSRVCTHAGCPVALYRASSEQLMCPCHQSVFDAANGAAVVSGPADHPLPRLPVTTRADGVLVADGDFPVPVGPGFWEQP